MLPLKEGMIRYAYERNLVVQPVLAFGVENAMSEFTFRKNWSDKCTIEYFVSDIIDPRDYKPGSKSGNKELTREAFHQKIEDVLYSEFERNHELVLPENNRLRYLREGEEKELYNAAKKGCKSVSMKEYAREKRRKKRS